MIITPYYEDPHTLHIGTEPPRSYYIPCGSAAQARAEDPRQSSQRLQLLNGTWQFAYYPSIHDLKEPFYTPGADRTDFADLPVPSVWQMHGYDRHQYTNNRYPFPYDPPYVPLHNPCGAYVHRFTIAEQPAGWRQYLNFEGVDSCFYVWVNGTFVGYSQVSHSTSEWDITDCTHPGENELAVLVLKWCDGSYLEDQDKFRMSGIFRDVYILHRPGEHICDFTVTTPLSENYTKAAVKVDLIKTSPALPVKYTLLDSDSQPIATGETADAHIAISVENPHLWNAETPYLYTLLLETADETLPCAVGLREISVKDSVLLLNGQHIVFRGVNRHDSSPVDGPTVSKEHVLRDLEIMRRHNINAIRTSHYPNAPYLPELCDRYGFYMIAEGDLEANGPCTLYGRDNFFSALAMDTQYTDAWVDRVKLLHARDKNRPCILMWSIGNESGYGINTEAALAYIKKADPTRLTHYESDYVVAEGFTPDRSNLDTVSRMYPPLEQVENYCRDGSGLQVMIHSPETGDRWEDYDIHGKNPHKPFVICEHSHSMGNSAGDYEDYYGLTMKYDTLCGGFIWEWCDHAIYAGRTPDNRDIYHYGGDSGEFPHDGNFCLDGLVYPDRRVHTALKEYKNVIRPARITKNGSQFSIRNMYDFADLQERIYIGWEITVDGKICANGRIDSDDALHVLPHQTAPLPFTVPAGLPEGHRLITFTYYQKNAAAFVPADFVLGFDQCELSPAPQAEWTPTPGHVNIRETEETIVLTGADFRYVFNRFTGTFDEMIIHNQTLLEQPMEFNVWRAPTDNDRYIRTEWENAGYDRTASRAYEVTAVPTAYGACIKARLSMSAVYLQRLLDVEAEWRVDGEGKLAAALSVKKNPAFPHLPRFGLRLFLPKDMQNVSYYGYGPYESYADKHQASWLGQFDTTVKQLHEDYIRPQENGSHWGCRTVSVRNADRGLQATALQAPFSFNASPYTQEALTSAAHNYQLQESSCTVFCLDYAQSGIGSHSCGPELKKEYRVNERDFTFAFALTPFFTDAE